MKEENKMEYTLRWYNSYNPNNWYDEKKDIDGVQVLKDIFPIIEIDYVKDGWVNCLHEVMFVANTIEKAKQEVKRILEESGRVVEVFSVYDKKNKLILIEEDF